MQVELGLLPERITPRKRWLFADLPDFVAIRERAARRQRNAAVREARSHASARAKAAAKRKQEKQARRKNRRRK